MKWTVLAIALVACAIVVSLWRSGGENSTPMLVVAIGIALFCSIVPLAMSKRRPTKKDREETIVRDR